MTDEAKYLQLQERQKREWEQLCRNCGACCGAVDGDPCEHLIRGQEGKYLCAIYTSRFGIHKTKNGNEICCVPIRDILHKSWPGDECCGYKKKSHS